MNYSIKIIFAILLSAFTVQMGMAQTTRPSQSSYELPQVLEIGKIEVTGNNRSDANSIISISGLREGNKITIPGTDIKNALHKLWGMKLFSDAQIYITKQIGEIVFLEIAVKEVEKVAGYDFVNVKSSEREDLESTIERILIPGTIITENSKVRAKNFIKNYYREKGYYNTQVTLNIVPHPIVKSNSTISFVVDKKKKVKVSSLSFSGNENIPSKRLNKLMKKTKKKIIGSSTFDEQAYNDEKLGLIGYYNTLGYRDAKIAYDTVAVNPDGNVDVSINIHEGNVYHVRNIVWRGNTIYPTNRLARILNIRKGDVYDAQKLETKLRFSQDGSDISSLYLDNGYLFFNVNPVEVAIVNDSIDLEINIFEGKEAIIDEVIIKGNTRTHEHVIRRELRTKPGATFSRSAIIRSQRELSALGYFNNETIQIDPVVDQATGTVDIVYTVEEKSSDQLELSAGWGGRGRGIVGTLGVTFNNFSLRNTFNKSGWGRLPQGDGQRLSVRAQSNGRFFQSYNFSFTEPWFGGKKPTALSLSAFHTRQSNFGTSADGQNESLITFTGGTLGLGKRLKFPDDNFTSNTQLSFKNITLENNLNSFRLDDNTFLSDGSFNTLSIIQTITRNTVFEPIYPRSGSRISLSAELTPPYSLFSNKDFEGSSPQEKFDLLEFHKWKFNAEWYTPLGGKFVLKARAKFGFLGFYNRDLGLSPFERFELGGEGLSQGSFVQARDIISLRGYDTDDVNLALVNEFGANVYNKYTIELRYPFSLNPSATIFGIGFIEGGNAFTSFEEFDPFNLNRSVGFGLRLFLPIFGTVGFDYGFGIDQNFNFDANPTDYGKFSIIIGVEPE